MSLHLDIEAATYASWPSFEQIDYRGWVLRAAEGCTKRANSANIMATPIDDVTEAVTYCESFFKVRRLPAIFRQLSFIEDTGLDQYLADAGYLFFDPSLVLYQPLKVSPKEEVIDCDLNREDWFPMFCQVVGQKLEQMAVHARIIERVPSESIFVVAKENGSPVATGFGSIHNGCFGIFDVVTHPKFRRRGHSTRLIRQMLSWARKNGAQHAYVQVIANNTGAVRLYENLGYRRLYHYWYRVQQNPS